MDAYECIITKIDIREYSVQNVPLEIRQKILEAARSTGTGLNTQHWKFILVEKKDNLNKLSEGQYKRKVDSRSQFCNNSSD